MSAEDFVNRKDKSELSSADFGDLMTAYKNNIVLHYGTCLQQILARLIDIRSRKNTRTAEFNNACQVCIYTPAQKLRQAVASRHPDLSVLTPPMLAIYNTLAPVLNAYDAKYRFAKDNRYYDAKANPLQHLHAHTGDQAWS
ncbi:hypothetical protein DL89DRAFT_296355 [Linderina pennispora]|uniref:Uncharacterized protein n=1 Tax=Linderina pennispora TaxID=61395 RepID=A0A1Y1VVI7_9FUNG|nr:uncharacterized protein DL89DRAFT_296355 [Linderina pennispora]ORX65312.1 hypothetical protein DL89DRAFT_296355 [Linderina pennispora]